MGRGRVELPTHGFSIRRLDCATSSEAKDLRFTPSAVAHHLPNDTCPISQDADLADLVEAWPKLPAAIRAGILAMIRTCKT